MKPVLLFLAILISFTVGFVVAAVIRGEPKVVHVRVPTASSSWPEGRCEIAIQDGKVQLPKPNMSLTLYMSVTETEALLYYRLPCMDARDLDNDAVRKFQYRQPKIHGYVTAVEDEAFWGVFWFVDDRDTQFEGKFVRSFEPCVVGTYFSLPARRDVYQAQRIKLPPWTNREILQARSRARQYDAYSEAMTNMLLYGQTTMPGGFGGGGSTK